MNEDLQKKLSVLEGLIRTQEDSVTQGNHLDYMHGMANGMILAHSIFAKQKPRYISKPKRFPERIRHKSNKLKGRR
jgi:hypothetical protein